MSEEVVFFGPGRAGLSLGYALHQSGQASLTYYGRRPEPPAHPLFTQGLAEYAYGMGRPADGTTAVILSVPDDVVLEIANQLAAMGPAPDGCSAFHLSGSLSTEALAPLYARGYAVGSMHPLAQLTHPVSGADRLAEAAFAVSGDPDAEQRGKALVRLIGARPIQIPVRARPAYHAAAVMASNYMGTLLVAAARLLSQSGISEEEALTALLPLAQGSLEDVASLQGHRSLIGPVVRGDRETIALHLRALDGPDLELYRTMGRELVRLCVESGLDKDRAAEILQVLGSS